MAVLLVTSPGEAQKRLLILDEGRKNLVMTDEASPASGWTLNLGPSRGMQLIGNNRVLVSTPAGYKEVELGKGEVLLTVERWTGIEDARRLPNGHVMLGANAGGKITLIEVDQNLLEIRRTTLNVPISKGMRQMRIGKDGNFYIAADDQVHVADAQGRLLRSLPVPQGSGSYKAVRADDGTLWASSGYGGTLVRMTETGSLLMTYAIPQEHRSPIESEPNFASDFQIRENGNVLLSVWHGHSDGAGGHGKSLIEFNPQGEVVWTWEGAPAVSSIHGAIDLAGLDTEILNDERSGPMGPLAYSFTAQGPGLPKSIWSASELFKEIGQIMVPPAPPDTLSAYPNGNNYVTMYKGYMLVPFASDHMLNQGGFQFWDMADPRNPKPAFTHNDRTTRSMVEVHGYGFTSIKGRDYACFQDRYGISLWDFTDIRNLKKISTLALPGIGDGGYDNGVFGVFWQYPYVYAAGSAHGLFVIDAGDVTKPKLIKQVPGSVWGNFRIGNTWAIGNLLLASSVRNGNNRGLAFFDIGNPANPVLLSVPITQASYGFYSALFNGNKIYLGGDERIGEAGRPSTLHVYEMFDFPNLVLDGTIPNIEGTGEYQFIQDDNVLWGMEALWVKANLKNGNYRVLGSGKFPETTFHGQQEGHPTPLGNVILLGDDHTLASGVFVHDVKPDDVPPAVNMVVPANGAIGQNILTRVGVSFSDQIDIQSINESTFVLRPKSGGNLTGHYSVQQYIANFTPEAPLLPDQVYEVLIKGVKDVSGNVLAEPFQAAFSTGTTAFQPPGAVILKGGQLGVTASGAPGLDASRSHDLNTSTYWQSTGALPGEIVIDMKTGMRLRRLKYYPRKDAGANGFITRYEIHTSSDKASWTKAAGGNWDGNLHTKYADFSSPQARYVKLVALEGSGGVASAVEFSVEAEFGGSVSLPPRPAASAGRVSLDLPHFGKVGYEDVGPLLRIDVVDASGTSRAILAGGRLDAFAFPPPKAGLYILRMTGKNGSTSIKIVL